MIQTPAPPVPDVPFPQVIVGPDVIPPWIPYIAALGIIMVGLVLWPLVRALARRIEGKAIEADQLRAEVEALHQRVAELEQVEHRMAELENRVEFSERLLTQNRAEQQLQRGSP